MPGRRPLESIKVAKPCPVSWSSMCGTDRVRHCSKCDRKVYNVSDMTGEEAEKLIGETEGRLCLRFYRRSDGRIMTRDCGHAIRAGYAAKLAAAACMSAIGIPLAMAGDGEEVMGDIMPTLTKTTAQARVKELEQELHKTHGREERSHLTHELQTLQETLSRGGY